MWSTLIETPSAKKMERAMDASNLRQQLLSQNLANVNTPYYKRLDIDFSSVFTQEIDKNELQLWQTHSRHLGGVTPVTGSIQVTRETKTLERYDQNNIDPEYEMAQVAENSLFFQSLTTSWNREMSRIKQAIDGR
ncbi:MAG TPA: flagellar basal body rod protein FlgB [Bacillota bacterium]